MHRTKKLFSKPQSIRKIVEKELERIRYNFKRDSLLKNGKLPMVAHRSIISGPRTGPSYSEKKITFQYNIIDLDKLASRLKKEGINFEYDGYNIRIGNHIKISEDSIFLGVDSYPKLMRILSECLANAAEVVFEMKKSG